MKRFPKSWGAPIAAFLPLLVALAAQVFMGLMPLHGISTGADRADLRIVTYAALALGLVCAVLLIPFLWAIGRGKRSPTFLPVGIAALPTVAGLLVSHRLLHGLPLMLGIMGGPPQTRTLFIGRLLAARAWFELLPIALLLSVAFALLVCAAARSPKRSRVGLAAGVPALLALGVLAALSIPASHEAIAYLVLPVVGFAGVTALSGWLTGEDGRGVSTGALTLAATFSAGLGLFRGVDAFRTAWISSLLMSVLKAEPSARRAGLQHAFAQFGQLRSAAFWGLLLAGVSAMAVVAIAIRRARRMPRGEPEALEITARDMAGHMRWTGPWVTLALCVGMAAVGWRALASELMPGKPPTPLAEGLKLPHVSGHLKAMGYPPSVALTSSQVIIWKKKAIARIDPPVSPRRLFNALKQVRGGTSGVLSVLGWGTSTLTVSADGSVEAGRLDALAGAAEQAGYSQMGFVVLPPGDPQRLAFPELLRPLKGVLVDIREKVLIGLPSSKDAPLGVGAAYATVDPAGRIQEFDSAGQPTASKGALWLFPDEGVSVETLLRAATTLRARGNPPFFLPLVKPKAVTRDAIFASVAAAHITEVLRCARDAMRHRERPDTSGLSLTVTADGHVSKVDLQGGGSPTPSFEKCLRSKLEAWRFPKARALYTLNAPLSAHAARGAAPQKSP